MYKRQALGDVDCVLVLGCGVHPDGRPSDMLADRIACGVAPVSYTHLDVYKRQVEVLLREPYFAKIALQFKEGAPAKELYIGSAGISDENYRRLVDVYKRQIRRGAFPTAGGCA